MQTESAGLETDRAHHGSQQFKRLFRTIGSGTRSRHRLIGPVAHSRVRVHFQVLEKGEAIPAVAMGMV